MSFLPLVPSILSGKATKKSAVGGVGIDGRTHRRGSYCFCVFYVIVSLIKSTHIQLFNHPLLSNALIDQTRDGCSDSIDPRYFIRCAVMGWGVYHSVEYIVLSVEEGIVHC